MGIKALVSKKAVAIGLAGTIGLGAVGTATYAAAPGLVDKIVGTWVSSFSSDMYYYKEDQKKSIPGKVGSAISSVTQSFSTYYTTKLEQSKKKVNDDVNAYIKEKSTLSDEERKTVESKFSEQADKKTDETIAELRKQIETEFAK